MRFDGWLLRFGVEVLFVEGKASRFDDEVSRFVGEVLRFDGAVLRFDCAVLLFDSTFSLRW